VIVRELIGLGGLCGGVEMIRHVEWVKVDELWFAKDPMRCGIFCGVTTEQLGDVEYLKRISANKDFWR